MWPTKPCACHSSWFISRIIFIVIMMAVLPFYQISFFLAFSFSFSCNSELPLNLDLIKSFLRLGVVWILSGISTRKQIMIFSLGWWYSVFVWCSRCFYAQSCYRHDYGNDDLFDLGPDLFGSEIHIFFLLLLDFDPVRVIGVCEMTKRGVTNS